MRVVDLPDKFDRYALQEKHSDVAVSLLYGAFPDRGGVIGGWTADHLPGHILTVILGIFLLIMSFHFCIKNLIHFAGGTNRMSLIPVSAFTGTLTGWVSSMMGIADSFYGTVYDIVWHVGT